MLHPKIYLRIYTYIHIYIYITHFLQACRWLVLKVRCLSFSFFHRPGVPCFSRTHRTKHWCRCPGVCSTRETSAKLGEFWRIQIAAQEFFRWFFVGMFHKGILRIQTTNPNHQLLISSRSRNEMFTESCQEEQSNKLWMWHFAVLLCLEDCH